MRNPAEQRPDNLDTARETEAEYVEPHFDRAGAEAIFQAWGEINAALDCTYHAGFTMNDTGEKI